MQSSTNGWSYSFTPSVSNAFGDFSEGSEINASDLLVSLFRLHPEYGAGKAKNAIRKLAGSTGRMVLTKERWIWGIGELLPNENTELHGRLLAVCVAILDPSLKDVFQEDNLIRSIIDEIKEPMGEVFNHKALDILNKYYDVIQPSSSTSDQSSAHKAQPLKSTKKESPKPTAKGEGNKTRNSGPSRKRKESVTKASAKAAAIALPDNVPPHGDHPALSDKLGRKGLAITIAKRIRRVSSDEKWRISTVEPSKTLFHFLWRKIKLASSCYRGDLNIRTPSNGLAGDGGAFMVHLHGPWGSGKSTLLNFIKDSLETDSSSDPWVVIYFNAWKYQRLGTPWWALMSEVYRQSKETLTQRGDKRADDLSRHQHWWRFFTIGGSSLLIVGALLLLTAVILPEVGASHSIKDISELLKNIGGIVAVGGSLWAGARYVLLGSSKGANALLDISGDPMDPLVTRFDELISQIGAPVAICIDDLDRCDAKYVVDLLQGIQTLFWNTQVAYLVAADRHWLQAAFEKLYSDFADHVQHSGRPLGYLFLEKGFQLSISVPKINSKTMESYLGHLVGIDKEDVSKKLDITFQAAMDSFQEHDTEESVIEFLQEQESSNADEITKQAYRQAAIVRLAEQDVEEETERSLKGFSSLLEPNPRSMKRFVNAYFIHRAVDIQAGRNTERNILALWTILEIRWPTYAEYLSENPEVVNTIENMNTNQVTDDFLKKLYSDTELKSVIRGGQTNSKLTPEAIRACTGEAEVLA